MFKSSKFSLKEWIVFYFLVPFPFVNIALLIFLVMRIGFLSILKKLLILLVLYILTFLAVLATASLF